LRGKAAAFSPLYIFFEQLLQPICKGTHLGAGLFLPLIFMLCYAAPELMNDNYNSPLTTIKIPA
jgi:hypothetical protein